MTLNKQLFCVSLLLLSLPWAGCQYLQEMDSLLRGSQQRALKASTEAIAAVLSQRSELLFPHGETYSAKSESQQASLYFYPLNAPAWVDGYGDEWDSIPSSVIKSPMAGHQLRYRTAIHQQQLYFLFEVSDQSIIYNNPSRSRINHGDRITLITGTGKHYIFTTSAPGNITARYLNGKLGTYRESTIEAQWQDTEGGYTLEIRLPARLAAGRLSFMLTDQNSQEPDDEQSLQYGPYKQLQIEAQTKEALPPWYVFQPQALQDQLAIFDQTGQRLKVFGPNAWSLAEQGNFSPESEPESHWLIRKLYRKLLDSQPHDYDFYKHQANSTHRQEVTQALHGKTSSSWYKDSQRSHQYIVASAAPIFKTTETGKQVIGAIVAEQSSEQMAALSDNAFNRLLAKSLSAIAVVALGLLGYASWLSWRIRRLSQAATQVISDDGKWLNSFPQSRANDEIGDLSRHYAQLLNRIKEYTEYLQTLSRKLSHELRTPLAIIHSSLDNLHNQTQNEQCETYTQRAKEGALRLGNILTAMSEASRVEESIEHAERENIDCAPLLNSLMQAYADVYPKKSIVFNNTVKEPSTLTTLYAVPDLIVQMLDKLMDNAASFCPDNGHIECRLEADKHSISIHLSNDGPLLPEKMRGQLFDNMVSLREDNQQSSHLGLGLHIVNLIVKYHQGQVSAHNRKDGSGVVFSVMLPKG